MSGSSLDGFWCAFFGLLTLAVLAPAFILPARPPPVSVQVLDILAFLVLYGITAHFLLNLLDHWDRH